MERLFGLYEKQVNLGGLGSIEADIWILLE